MADEPTTKFGTTITHSADVPFEAGEYIRTAGGPWWQTRLRIVSVDSSTTMTVRWEWWREPWVHIPVYYTLIWANYFVWAGWNASL